MSLQRLYDLSDAPLEIRMISGSVFWCRADDEIGQQRMKTLRSEGHDIVSLGDNAYQCKGQHAGPFNTQGRPFKNTPRNKQLRYQHMNRGFKFARVEKGVFRCTFRPGGPVNRATRRHQKRLRPRDTDKIILTGEPFQVPPGKNALRARIDYLRSAGHTIKSLGHRYFQCMNSPQKGISHDDKS